MFTSLSREFNCVFFYESKTCGTYRPRAKEVDREYVTFSVTHANSMSLFPGASIIAFNRWVPVNYVGSTGAT